MELFFLLLILCVLVTAADGNSPVAVKEGSDVVLPCSRSTTENLESKMFDWRKNWNRNNAKEVFMYDAGRTYGNGLNGQDKEFEGRVSYFPHELKNGNASIKITKTEVSDSGSYSCIFPRPLPEQSFSVQLVVECGPILKDRREENVEGACPKPSTKITKETNDQALLRCVVEGASTNPKVEWIDSSGKTLPDEGTKTRDSHKIILQTTVYKSDNYSCVVTQEDICHQVQDHILVVLSDAGLKPYVTSRQTEDGLLLQCKVLGVSSSVKVELKDSSGGTIPAEKSQSPGRGGSFDIILQTTVTKSDTYTCEVTSETNQTFSTQTDGNLKGSSAGWSVTGIVAGIFAFLFLLVAVFLGVWVYLLKKQVLKQKSRNAVKHDQDTQRTSILRNSGEKDETSAGHSNSEQPLNGQDGSC